MTISDIRVGLRTFLLADDAVKAACGGRCYPIIMPQGMVLPSIVYTRITGLGSVTMFEGEVWLSRPRFQITAWAQTHDLATSLANLVKERLSGYRGTMGDVVVQGAFYDSERDEYDALAMMFQVSRDYFIWYEEH